MSRSRIAAICFALVAVLLVGAGPWYARRRPHPRPNRLAMARVRVADWPDEPPSPPEVDRDRFVTALGAICGRMSPRRLQRYADAVLAAGAEFDVDPFLLGALVYRESRCRADAENGDRTSGVGLTLIHRSMYHDNLRHGRLRYQVREGGEWVERVRVVDRYPFGGPRLMNPEANLYFAAALLGMWREQADDLAEAFAQVPHRHFVSHFVWGDRVKSHRQEDRILGERRRLLEYYGAEIRSLRVRWGGLTFGCPLDGCPRVLSSWIGAERDGGERRHRGVDLESLPGEPVRAVADGLVIFAGVDLPGGQTHVQLRTEEEYAEHPRASLGAGGRYVCVRHRRDGEEHSVRSCYMHLERVTVRYGDRVTLGTQLGTVGRTGMTRSAAHLHLELATGHLEDPAEILNGLLLGHREADPL